MKIVYFLTGLAKTGGPMTLYNFMNGLVKKGHDVYVVTINECFVWEYNSYQKFINKHSYVNLFIIFISKIMIRLILSWKEDNFDIITKRLIKKYKQLNIDGDVLIATHINTAEAVFKLGFNKKIVLHSQHFEELMCHNKFDIANIKIYNNLPFNHIVNCSWLKQMFIFNYNIYPTIITPGMDHEIFFGRVNKKKYTKPKKIKVITYCDPNREFKGCKQQIQILEKLYALHKDILEIKIFGNDPGTDLFEYSFLGFVSQKKLAEYYREAHVSITFSWYESFPLPPIEAMACGCAVISTKYGTEDYLIDDENGKIIDSFNIEESVNIISEIIKNPKKMYEYTLNGKKASDKYSWGKQVDELDNFLKTITIQHCSDIKRIQGGDNKEMNRIFNK